MLQNIRDKTQGIFAWVILLLICIPFALWGIQNYVGGGQESPVASVGGKDFFQQDLARAYEQYAQNFAGMKFDENTLKRQALEQLIRDEVLFQHVKKVGLQATDASAREFIQNLEYFQTDGKFDKQKYNTLLGSQGMSSAEFVNRIKKALVMKQYQTAISDSAFVTQPDIQQFFAIKNQTRDIEYISVPLVPVTDIPSKDEIEKYYQQHTDAYRTEEQVAVEYVELSLDKLAADVKVSEEQLAAYYQEQKDLYTTKERRKISHILFAISKEVNAEQALDKARKARIQLKEIDFARLAEQISDDKLTAKKGGDLGLFDPGVLEPAFDEAASQLQLGEVSEPVKTSFGYHLIKVTELTPGEVKPLESIKEQLTKAYQKAQTDSRFYELGEKLSEVSFENPGSLQAVSDALGIAVQKTDYFTLDAGTGVAENEAVRNAAFSEDVLKGNNSEPIELGADKLIVLRLSDHKPSVVRALSEVKDKVIAALQTEKAASQASDTAMKIKKALQENQDINAVANLYHLEKKTLSGLDRQSQKLSMPVLQTVFKAAKPAGDKPVVVVATDTDGKQVVVRLLKVTTGTMIKDDKQEQMVAKNMAVQLGQNTFSALMTELQAKADVSIRSEK